MANLIKDYGNLMEYINSSGDKLDAKSRSMLIEQAMTERRTLLKKEQIELDFEEQEKRAKRTLPDREQDLLDREQVLHRFRRNTWVIILISILLYFVLGAAIYDDINVEKSRAADRVRIIQKAYDHLCKGYRLGGKNKLTIEEFNRCPQKKK